MANPATKIEFVQFSQAPLTVGDYQITVTQAVNIRGADQTPFTATRFFRVSGLRSAVTPADVHDVFPPKDSLGEHSNVLPHIVLNGSTRPWQRRADPARSDVSWLALLLFDEAEQPASTIVTLADLRAASQGSPWFPGLAAESGEDPTAKVTVVDVRASLLRSILPSVAELGYLAHVRRSLDDSNQVAGDELGVVIGNRLPAAGKRSVMHLVSIEGRCQNGAFNYQQAADGDLIRLVSLTSWSFACADEEQRFTPLLLNVDPFTNGVAKGPATMQLAPTANQAVNGFLSMGYVALPHTLREKSQTVSWYHGPLAPWNNASAVTLPVRAADELVRFYPSNGLFDVSYAAAWELGRLLTLKSRQAAASLYSLKVGYQQQLLQAEQHILHLPFSPPSLHVEDSDVADIVDAWFEDLNLLRGVPFNYLAPDERLLPRESMRFFYLDPVWIDCLLDGAFSIGRVTSTDFENDQTFEDRPANSGTITGFLLRSDAVTGWPAMEVSAQDANHNDLPLLRRDLVSAGVLLCLFKGEISTVAVRQKAETQHFGLDVPDGRHTAFFKKLRDSANNYQESETLLLDTIPWRSLPQRVLDVSALAQAIQAKVASTSFTSAQFALQMVEGVEEVVFEKGT